jgi:hypothetical protein
MPQKPNPTDFRLSIQALDWGDIAFLLILIIFLGKQESMGFILP